MAFDNVLYWHCHMSVHTYKRFPQIATPTKWTKYLELVKSPILGSVRNKHGISMTFRQHVKSCFFIFGIHDYFNVLLTNSNNIQEISADNLLLWHTTLHRFQHSVDVVEPRFDYCCLYLRCEKINRRYLATHWLEINISRNHSSLSVTGQL